MQKITSPLRYAQQLYFRRSFSVSKQDSSVDPRHSKLIILGAGFSGLVASAYIPKISNVKNFEIRVLEPRLNTVYTPNIDLVPFNLNSLEQIERPVLPLLNNSINIDFSQVESILPKKNTVITSDHKEYTYDYLILATGLNQVNNDITGLQEALEDRDENVVSTNRIEDVLKCKRKLEAFMSGRVIFYNDEKSKSPASGLNQAFLLDSYLRGNRGTGLRQMSHLQHVTNTKALFPYVKHSLRIQDLLREKDIEYDNFSLQLVEIDGKNKRAVFKDSSNKTVEKEYDLIFVNPKHEVSKALKGLTNPDGHLNVDPTTSLHKKYPNIFALGHCTRTQDFVPTRKSILEQGIILAYNLKLTMEAAKNGTKPEKLVRTSGATEIPIFIDANKCLLARFDPKNPDYVGRTGMIEYLKEVHGLPEIYFRLLSRGLWFEETGFRVPSLNTL